MTTWLGGKLTTTLREAPALLNFQCNAVLRWIRPVEMLDTRFGRYSTQLTFDQVVSFIEKLETSNKVIWIPPAMARVVAGKP